MDTKRKFLHMPGQGGQAPQPNRVIITYDPATGGTVLKTQGNFTIPMVIDILMGQLTSLWAQWIKGMSTGITDASGKPVVTPQATPMPQSAQAEPECTCGLDPYKAPEQHADDCPIRVHQKQVMQ